jgi:hypothetical protein
MDVAKDRASLETNLIPFLLPKHQFEVPILLVEGGREIRPPG